MRVQPDAKLNQAQWTPSPHFDARPDAAQVEMVVVHCVSLPEGEFGTGAPQRLFRGELDLSEHPSFADLAGMEVSPHLFIDRDGAVQQFVALDQRAWHAGLSSWCGRVRCNDYSIGIELEGAVNVSYTQTRYEVLADVLKALFEHFDHLDPANVVGHSEIAPGRKLDPGPSFDWQGLYERLRAHKY